MEGLLAGISNRDIKADHFPVSSNTKKKLEEPKYAVSSYLFNVPEIPRYRLNEF